MRKCLIFAAAVSAGSTGIAAVSDFSLNIEGVGRPTAAGPIYLKVVSAGDLDGDGVAERGIVRLACAGGSVEAAHFQSSVKNPRDAASGQASGKSAQPKAEYVKEWGASTPQFREIKGSWDIKKNEGGRVAADSDVWLPITLEGSSGVCPAAEAAAKVKATRSRSNIQNN